MTKGKRTAARILDVAEELFARDGYAATSLRDIAAAAGIQQPGLYKYFASKEELYRSVYQHSMEPLLAVLDEGAAAGDPGSFLALTDRLIDHLAARPNIARLLVRASLLPPEEADAVATEWLQLLVRHGEALNARAGIAAAPDLVALQILSVFHLVFGYFAAAPVTAAMTGRAIDDPHLIGLQKSLVAGFVASLQTSPATR